MMQVIASLGLDFFAKGSALATTPAYWIKAPWTG
jgi:hypothetical protein